VDECNEPTELGLVSALEVLLQLETLLAKLLERKSVMAL